MATHKIVIFTDQHWHSGRTRYVHNPYACHIKLYAYAQLAATFEYSNNTSLNCNGRITGLMTCALETLQKRWCK